MTKIRINLLGSFLVVIATLHGYGQCVVSKNSQGTIFTTCTMTSSRGTTVVQKLLLGSEFLTYPIWQVGTIDLDGRGKQQRCQLAFNTLKDEVTYRLDSDTTRIIISHPVGFIIANQSFSSLPYNVLGIKQRIYFLKLYEGKTKLFRHTKCMLIETASENNGYSVGKQEEYVGRYESKQEYFIQQNDGPLHLFTLTKKSLLRLLADKGSSLANQLPKGQLTIDQVIEALTYYDSLPAQ